MNTASLQNLLCETTRNRQRWLRQLGLDPALVKKNYNRLEVLVKNYKFNKCEV